MKPAYTRSSELEVFRKNCSEKFTLVDFKPGSPAFLRYRSQLQVLFCEYCEIFPVFPLGSNAFPRQFSFSK